MPIFTVTIEGNGKSKTVYVNTETMEANVAPQSVPGSSQVSTVESVAEPEVDSDNMGLKGLFNQKAGKRSASSFRLKKRRITRKLKKTR